MRPTIMEVDTKKFNENIDKIQEFVGNKTIIPVLKGHAYGTWINLNLDVINRFDIIALAIVDEAVEVRKLGYRKEIFILNQPYIDDLENIVNYDIVVGLSSKEFLDEVIKSGKKIRVHLEIETGMNRTGIKLGELEEYIAKIKSCSNILVEGVYTHLSSADSDEEFTLGQLEKFKKAVAIVKSHFDTIKYIHSSASKGFLNYDDGISNAVRPGMIMYGYEPCDDAEKKIPVEPICKLKTKVTFIKDVETGESVGYSRTFIAKEKRRIATIPIGYVDGIRRQLSNKTVVVANREKARVVGNICMDSCMIDVTGIENVEVGTDVYIWDNDIRKIEDIAAECNTTKYEVLSTISYRIPRIFV